MWDHEVDLVTIGAGIGGLAGAIATVDAGNEVLVVNAATNHGHASSAGDTRQRVRSLRGWLQTVSADVDTRDFFAGCAEWVPDSASLGADVPVPVRVASPVDCGAVAEPFLGSRLAEWAAACLTSPYGMLYAGVSGQTLTTMRAAEGGTIEVVPIGTMKWSRGAGESELREWMAGQAHDRGIDVLTQSPLHRLVFDDGHVTGAVFATPDGPFAVRARRGVSIAPSEPNWVAADRAPVAARGETRQVCLLGRTASRFGRVELLVTTESAFPARPAACPATRRSVTAGLHEMRPPRSGLRCCGKADRNPPVGQ